MPMKKIPNPERSALSAEQKVAFALLMFLGIGGVFFGFKSFGANLIRPVELQFAEYANRERVLTTDEREKKEIEESKKRDTDVDGLTDYDELYVFKTSPYLDDSDSDGVSDQEEIFSGEDPNCPIGKTCGAVATGEATVDSTGTDVKGVLGTTVGANSILSSGGLDFATGADVEAFFRDVTMDEIRSALLQSGVPAEQLEALDDDTLRDYFDQAVDNTSAGGAFDSLKADLGESVGVTTDTETP